MYFCILGLLPTDIVLFYPFTIFTGANIVNPIFILQIPIDGMCKTGFKIKHTLPAQLRFKLCTINSIATVMPEPIGYMSYESGNQSIILTFYLQPIILSINLCYYFCKRKSKNNLSSCSILISFLKLSS